MEAEILDVGSNIGRAVALGRLGIFLSMGMIRTLARSVVRADRMGLGNERVLLPAGLAVLFVLIWVEWHKA